MLTIFLVTFLVTSVIWWAFKTNKHPSLPPGPMSFPVVGSLLSVRGDVRDAFCRMAQTYGDIFTVDLGCQRTIVLASYSSIREALVNKATAFSGRPASIFTQEVTRGKGVVPTEGLVWKEHRRFITHAFRELGVGRKLYEPFIHEEIEFFFKEIRGSMNEPYDPKVLLLKATFNVLCRALYGQRYDYDDPVTVERLHLMDQNTRMISSTAILDVFPFLKCFPRDMFGFKTLHNNLKKQYSIVEESIKQHRLYRSENVHQDIVSAYLDEKERLVNGEAQVFTDDQLKALVQQLIAAGTGTTSVTLLSTLLHMLHHPDVMQRVQREIDDVIGPSRMPSMHDIRDMPYTAAVLQEVQRMGDLVPFSIPHRTTREVRLRDYVIPPDTQVFAMLHAAHRDPKVYTDPYQFKPERFIAGDKPAEEPPIPFSLGPRRCLGENLAQMEVFLFFVALLQRFRIRSVPGCTLPEVLGPTGLVACPEPFEIIFEEK